MKKFLSCAAVLTVLAGCTTTPADCDPNIEHSLFTKMACSASGSYDQRIREKERTLASEQRKSQELAKIQQMVAAQQAGVQRSKAQSQAQLNQLNKSVNNLTSELKQKAQGKRDVLDKIDAVEQQMAAVNRSSSSEVEKQQELKKLQARLSALQKVVDL